MLHPELKQQTTRNLLPRRATRLSVSLRWRVTREGRQNCVRFAYISGGRRSTPTDSTRASSSSATWNDVCFELKHRARMGAT